MLAGDHMSNGHFIYILRCADDTLYSGYAVNIKERMEKHSQGKGAKYTRGRGPFELVYWEEFATKEEAMQREWHIKQLPREKKINLIESHGDKTMAAGNLYLCATPIGNLEDITLRVLRTLKEVDLIAAEDTRHTRKLLTFYDIHKPLVSYHEHNKKEKGPVIIEKLLSGLNIALVTDAGTPAISDPGHDLVKLAIERNISITALPGASAFVTALTVSGLPTEEFVFLGFLPIEKKKRRLKLEKLAQEHRTIILYEAPHRLKTTLSELCKYLTNREAVAVRELTKKFEEIKRSDLEGLLAYFNEKTPRGEFCLVISGQGAVIDNAVLDIEIPLTEEVFLLIENGMNKKEAIKEVARRRGIPKRDVYNQILEEE